MDNMEMSFDRRFDDLYRELESKIEHVDSEMNLRINDTISYIDSRIDKLQNNIKEKGSKELLKG
jgi:chaperonin cofactor prefoldin